MSQKMSQKMSRKMSRKMSQKMSRKMSRKCQKALSNKIKINMKEYKTGRYISPKQAIAVSYSQTIKKYPRCKFTRKKH